MATKKNYTISTIFGLGKALGLSPEDTKAMAYGLIGKDSLKKFTQREINDVCYTMMQHKDKQLDATKNPSRASNQQLYRIRELEKLLGWAEEPERLQAFLRKRFKVVAVEWLSGEQASKVIEALKQMHRRKEAAG